MVKVRNWLFVFAALVGCARTVESEGTHYEADLFFPPTTEGGYPRESHFVSDEEAAALIAAFDWQETEALPEFEPDGSPAVFYAVVQLTSMDESNLLHEANVPTSIEPFFESERRVLPDGAISLSAGNSHSGFVFALMPA